MIFVGKKSDSQKNRPISRDFSGKKSNYKGFSGANSKKNRPISGGNFAKKQSVKNSRFCFNCLGKIPREISEPCLLKCVGYKIVGPLNICVMGSNMWGIIDQRSVGAYLHTPLTSIASL